MKRMKIGIIGININTFELNYGAVLHAWAFSKVLDTLKEQCNLESIEIVDYTPEHTRGKNVKYPVLYFVKNFQLKRAVMSFFCMFDYAKRYESFQKFCHDQLKVSKEKFVEDIDDTALNYDCVIVESDVVWAKLAGKFNKVFFLNCDSMKDMRRIAYGPDIGDLEANEQNLYELREMLKAVEYISCRGTAPLHILEQCTDKKVQPVLDPTLLISRQEYDDISSERLIDEAYVLYYYIENNPDMRNQAEKFAKENNLKLVELTSRLSKNNIFRIRKLHYSFGISEFVSLIKYSECVFTDSFHGICVSVQYKKSFFAYPRQKEQKVLDLCRMLGVKERYMLNKSFADVSQDMIDYEKVDRLLNDWKKTSIEWLKDSLS